MNAKLCFCILLQAFEAPVVPLFTNLGVKLQTCLSA